MRVLVLIMTGYFLGIQLQAQGVDQNSKSKHPNIERSKIKSEAYGKRYLSPIFSHVHSRTITYYRDVENPLRLDYYWPKGDAEEKRPLIIYVHGGGFSGGQKDEPHQVQFAQQMAKRGFAVAAISYRLTMRGQSFGCDQLAKNKIKTFKYATEDIWKATNFILDRAQQFGIDKEKIILAGSSAGAEAVLHAAYWTAKDLRDLKTRIKLPKGFRYGGLISMSGAITDTALINADNAIPSLLFHGSCDELVPFESAPHHYCNNNDKGFLVLHGANSIAKRLHNLNKPYWLLAECGGGHEWNYLPMRNYVQGISETIWDFVIEDKTWQQRDILNKNEPCKFGCGEDWQ